MSEEIQRRLNLLEDEIRYLRSKLQDQDNDQNRQRATPHPLTAPAPRWNPREQNGRTQVSRNAGAATPSWSAKARRKSTRPNCGNEIPPLRHGPQQFLYRLTIHTHPSDGGGTEGDAFFCFAGSADAAQGTDWLYFDNPNSSFHSAGDVDLYYFYNSDLGDEVQHQVALEANRPVAEDQWRWEGWLHKLENDSWHQQIHMPETVTPANGDIGCDTFRNTGAAHLDGRTKQWTTWKAAGIEFQEVSDFTPSQVHFLKMIN